MKKSITLIEVVQEQLDESVEFMESIGFIKDGEQDSGYDESCNLPFVTQVMTYNFKL